MSGLRTLVSGRTSTRTIVAGRPARVRRRDPLMPWRSRRCSLLGCLINCLFVWRPATGQDEAARRAVSSSRGGELTAEEADLGGIGNDVDSLDLSSSHTQHQQCGQGAAVEAEEDGLPADRL